MRRGRRLTVVPWRAGSDEGYDEHPLRRDLVVVSTHGRSDVGRSHLLARSVTAPSGAPPTVVLSPPAGRRWTWPRAGETVYADVWDVAGDERYATAAFTGPLPPDGTPVLCACRDRRRRAHRARALREHHPEIIRRTGYADEDDPPYARVTASQRFVDPEGRREWMLLHVAPNEKNVPSPLLVTSRYSPAWEEPRPEGPVWSDGGSVSVSSWDVSAEPAYVEPADTTRHPPVAPGRRTP